MTDLAAIDHQPCPKLGEIKPPPITDRLAKHDTGIPHIAGDHGRRAEPLIIVPQIFQDFDGGHAALHRGSHAISASALRQILAEPHRDLGFDPEPAIVSRRQFGAAVMHLTGKDRAVAWLVDAAQLLHDWRRQTDFVSNDLASSAGPLDLFKSRADGIGLVDICWEQLGGQNIDLMPLAEQRGDALSFLPRIECQWRSPLAL